MQLFKHNLRTCTGVIWTLQQYGECALDQATGTGKTYITMQLLTTLFRDLDVLYVVPSSAIADGIQMYRDWDFDNVTFTQYASLYKITKFPDVLILDELHRAGAPTWLKEVKRLKSNARYTLGLSATPVRYLDGGRNMADELFSTHTVHGPNLVEAVSSGILPGFEYIAILADIVDVVEKIHTYQLSANVKERLNRLCLNDYDLKERLRRNIPDNFKRGIIFFPNIRVLENSDDDIRDWFGGDIEIYQIHSRQSRKINRATLEKFNISDRAVLKVVDIANEGLHIEGVNLLIFARKTISGNIFLQQIGRALSVSSDKSKPRILDLVGNFANLHILSNSLKHEVKHTKYVQQSEILYDKIIISYDEVALELEDIYSEVSLKWDKHMDAILTHYWDYEGKDVYKRLVNKTPNQCTARARKLGLVHSSRWTADEDSILAEYYNTDGDAIYKRLPGRTLNAIKNRARYLKLADIWSAEDDLLLMTSWGGDVSPLLNSHSMDSILSRAKKLGL